MTEAKHTPGPWATFNGTDVFPDDGDTRGDHQIADAMPRGSFLEVGEMMANAQLIAAAPDMLEALEHVYTFIADEFGDAESQALDGEHVSREARPVWNSICNAIAKAREGERT